MESDKAKVEELERRLRRLEALFIVLFANDAAWQDDEPFFHELIERFGHFSDPPFFEEMLHRFVRHRPRGRFSELERRLSKLQDTVAENQLSFHQYLSLALLGAPLDDIPMRRIVPMRVYLKKDDAEVRDALAEAVTEFANELGFDVADDLPAEKGSWFKRWFGKTSEALRQPEVRERLEKGERALELHALQRPQAAVDRDQAEGAAALIAAVEKTDDAICQIGSILLVKTKGKVVARTLTQKELIHIEKHPELLKTPEEILTALSACEREPAQVVAAALPPAGVG